VATTYTTNALLQKPATTDRYWDVPLNANADFLDGVAAIGRLLVTPTEAPSASLNVRVTPGTYVTASGTVGTFPGIASHTLPASTSITLWLTDAGVLSTSAAFPTTPHVRLATVVTGPSSVQSIIDERIGPRTCGTGIGTAITVSPDGTAIGFFGTSPAGQAAAIPPLNDTTTGVASNTVADVGPAFSQSQIDNNFAALTAKVNALIAVLKSYGLTAS
jgi:hypothetical protein